MSALGKTAYARVVELPGQRRVAVLQRLHQSPSQFMNLMRDIVHDLKIPIASAKGFVDLVGAAGDLNDKQAEFAQRALGSLDTMLTRVHELLDMAWLETGGELAVVPTDLVDLVRQTVTDLEPFARRQRVQLNLDLPERCPIQADERRLMSAINNLISNAVKYSPEGGPVDISVRRRHDDVIVRVEDNGLGIEPEHLPHIFQRFYRIHTPRTQRIEGTGLGLEIAQAIIKHGGDIHVQSQPNAGSVFWFRRRWRLLLTCDNHSIYAAAPCAISRDDDRQRARQQVGNDWRGAERIAVDLGWLGRLESTTMRLRAENR